MTIRRRFLLTKAGMDIEIKAAKVLKTSEVCLEIKGYRARAFMQDIATGNLARLEPGQAVRTYLLDRQGRLLANVAIARALPDEHRRDRFWMSVRGEDARQVKAWL